MSIDHVSIPVTLANFEAEVNFLSAALEPLGIKEQMRVVPEAVGFGKSDTGPFLWVGAFTPDKKPISGIFAMHVALIARSEYTVKLPFDIGTPFPIVVRHDQCRGIQGNDPYQALKR